MCRTSATIRRCQWLLVLLTIGLVAELQLLSTANTCPVLTESCETFCDGEDVELDDSLNLMARLCRGPKLQIPGHQENVAAESASTNLVLAACHYERGPPCC